MSDGHFHYNIGGKAEKQKGNPDWAIFGTQETGRRHKNTTQQKKLKRCATRTYKKIAGLTLVLANDKQYLSM